MKRSLTLLALALVLLTLAAAPACALTVTDMHGRTVEIAEPVSRVVALNPADCEILYALGCGELLVGRGEYCDYPAEVMDIPSVQTGYETNVEQIIALAPQLLIMNDMAQTTEQVQALESAGIAVLVSDTTDIADAYEVIRMIGSAVSREAEAEAVIADMLARFDAVAAASSDTGKTVYFEISPLEYGLWTAGQGTFMDEIASICGLTNAFADVQGWSEVSEEQVIARAPDYIVTTTVSYDPEVTAEQEIMARAGWQDVPAVRDAAVFCADNSAITRPGPRLADAAEALMAMVQTDF